MSSVTAPADEPSGNSGGEAVVIALAGRRIHVATGSEAGYGTLATDGSLALKVPAPAGPAARTPPDIEAPPAPHPPAAEVTRIATIVARALLEVLSGWRPPSQLVRWTSFSLQQDLESALPAVRAGSGCS